MLKTIITSAALLFNIIATTKIDFSKPNKPIKDDLYYGVKIGNLDKYKAKLNETERSSEYAQNSRMAGFQIEPASISDTKYHAKIAGASYCEDKALKSWNCKHCTLLSTKVKLHKVINDPKYQTKAIITTNDERQEIVLSFRGTSNLKNWIQNLRFDKTEFPVTKGAQVHHGFKDITDSLQFMFNPEIKKLRAIPKYKNYDLIVSGHSLGGAVAILASIYLVQEQKNLSWTKVKVFTYEQPRVGNHAFAEWYNTLPTTVTRVVNTNDIVPHIPPMFANYRHVFSEVYINKGKTKVCNKIYMEDPSCSNYHVPFLAVPPHSNVWDIKLGVDGC